jgi:hypothetical protein
VERWRNAINIAVALIGMAAVAALILAAWANRFDPVLTELVVRNFAAIIGLPFAFLAPFIVVALFRQAEGAIEIELTGLKLQGAAGQIVLWVLCFLAITGAIALLWRN